MLVCILAVLIHIKFKKFKIKSYHAQPLQSYILLNRIQIRSGKILFSILRKKKFRPKLHRLGLITEALAYVL